MEEVERNWYTVFLGRGYYPVQDEIIEWCRKNIGVGGWYPSPGDKHFLWAIENSFGHISISFRNQKDFVWFSLIWN